MPTAPGSRPPGTDALDAIVGQWERERPDLDPVPMALLGRITRLYWMVDERLNLVFGRFGLGRGEFDVLGTLRRSGPPFELTAGELSGSMMVTSGAVTKRVDRLERAGLVGRRTAEGDARGRLIRLTEEGRELIDRAVTAHVENERRLVSGLTAEEQETLSGLLRRLTLTMPDARP
ncbi:MarR family winged helix-turn-helix transcriptional regulator [Kitasatospora sp. NPDC006697]|uniref:MarR family winged helix-turn-helix transcriptional regulator n=1 Tax=Kitasatospora sp. NPDC006697 TaxID=3364020 RepID=UPI0036A1380B